MRDRIRIDLLPAVIVVLAALLGGCGGGSSAPAAAYPPGTSFWAIDFARSTQTETWLHKVFATRRGTGTHCYVYVEYGRTVSQSTIDAIVNEFDTTIHPGDTANFGDEPDRDNDPRITILLMDIRDGFSGSGGYFAGYFFSLNEEPIASFKYSNQKEMFYMDIKPGTPGGKDFYNVLAHEFQHMIHWNQEQLHKSMAEDDTWLNEAMSEIAPVYLYGPSYSRVRTFEQNSTNSLTDWQSTLADYGVVYMWSQYFMDRFAGASPNIFKSMLQNDQLGIASVDLALSQINSSYTFTTTFKDWGIALYTGNTQPWGVEHPEWSYSTISTATGTYNGVPIPGLFTSANTNLASFATPSIAGFVFYSYTPISGSTGTVRWNASADSTEKGILIDLLPTINTDLVSGQDYTFTTAGYLIVSNPTASVTGTDTVTRTSLLQSMAGIEGPLPFETQQTAVIKTPKAMLDDMNKDPHVRKMVQETGKPIPVCIHPYLKAQAKALKAKGGKFALVRVE